MNESLSTELGQAVDQYLQIEDSTPKVQAVTILGHSTLETLITCPRQYVLNFKNLVARNSKADYNTAFGNVFHEGCQTFWRTKNLPLSLLAALQKWPFPVTEGQHKTNKTIWDALYGVILYAKDFAIPLVEKGFELHEVEASGSIQLPNGYRYCLHVDLVLRDPQNDSFLIQEFKTGSQYFNPARYGNSRQAIGYSVAIRTALNIKPWQLNTEYVYYCSQTRKIDHIDLPVSRESCVQFLLDILTESDTLTLYRARNYFPKRGTACMKYNVPCKFFGLCEDMKPSNIETVQMPEPQTKYNCDWQQVCSAFDISVSE